MPDDFNRKLQEWELIKEGGAAAAAKGQRYNPVTNFHSHFITRITSITTLCHITSDYINRMIITGDFSSESAM